MNRLWTAIQAIAPLCAGILLLATKGFSGSVISVDFVGGGPNGAPPALAPADIAGVVPASDWNDVAQDVASGLARGLLDNSGALTSAAIVWSSDNTWSTVIPDSNADFEMMKGYLDNPTNDIYVSFSGVPYPKYDVYVYFNDDNTSGGTVGSYSIGSSKIFGKDPAMLFNGTFTRADGTSANDPNALGNYVVFQGVTGEGFKLLAHPEDSAHRSPVNGLQIVEASPVVFGWGTDFFGIINPLPSLSNVVAIAAGEYFSLALQGNGTVVAWGNDPFGETNVPADLSNVIAISASGNFSLALQSNGTVVAWGDNDAGQTNVPPGLSNVVAISAGYNFSLALQAYGTIVPWGDDTYGQTNVPPGLSNVIAISAGGDFSLALQSTGQVVAWGDNTVGETDVPPGLSNVVAIAAGEDGSSLALESNGSLVAWGYNGSGETNVPTGLSNVVAIAAGEDYFLALLSNGTVVAWGDESYGKTSVPAGLSSVVAIAAGLFNSLSLTYSPPPTPPPANDDFADATVLTGTGIYVNGSNFGATTEPGESAGPWGVPSGASVWWTWTATQKGSVTFSLFSGFDTLVAVYTGDSVSNLDVIATQPRPGSQIDLTFDATVGTQYYIAVAGENGEQDGFSFSLGETVCDPPEPNPPIFTTNQTVEADGIHVLICADVQGTDLGPFQWSVNPPLNPISTTDEGDCFEVVVDPANEEDVSVHMTVTNACGNAGGDSPPVHTCDFCLSPDLPGLLTGTTGAGSGPPKSTDCGELSDTALWYRMIPNTSGMVTASTEGSSIKTLLTICTGGLENETAIACTNGFTTGSYESRITFKAVAGTVYWIVVDPQGGDTAGLRIAAGFQPHIESYGLKPDGSFTLQSSVGPPITYDLLASSTLSTNTNGWIAVLTTNLTISAPYVNYQDTNVHAVGQRFFRIGSDQ